MLKPSRKQPRRPHYLPEWAKSRGWKQKDLVELLDADKGLVSRWFAGTTPSEEWQERLAKLFGTVPDAIFRHPDEKWFAEFFNGRPEEEVRRIKEMLRVGYPKS